MRWSRSSERHGLTGVDASGRRRLDREDDFVRIEIATALERRIRVVPTLVGGATMPESNELPANLSKLTRRQALEISDGRFHQDVDRLIEALSGSQSGIAVPAHGFDASTVDGSVFPVWRWPLTVMAVILFAAVGYRQLTSRGEGQSNVAGAATSTDGGQSGDSSRRGSAIVIPPTPPASAASTPPATAGQPPRTGIVVNWKGANRASCYLLDESGQKTLSPQGVLSAWSCEPDTPNVFDAAPGKYQIKVDAPLVPLVPITVTAQKLTQVEPQTGRVRFHWLGANNTRWYLMNKDGTKFISPEGVMWAWDADSQKTDIRDVGPGEYVVKVGVPANLIPISVAAGKVVHVEPKIGQLRLRWNGSNLVSWFLLSKDGGTFLSPESPVWAWSCESGKTDTQDVSPGEYVVKVNAVGCKPMKVTVAPFKVTEISLP
jgi:hypothetical protein